MPERPAHTRLKSKSARVPRRRGNQNLPGEVAKVALFYLPKENPRCEGSRGRIIELQRFRPNRRLPSMSAPTIHLLVINDDGTELLFSLEPGSYVIGRDPSCDLVVPAPGISRRHARVTANEDSIVLEDLGSAGGLWLDTTQVAAPMRVSLPTSVGLGHLPMHVSSDRYPFLVQEQLPAAEPELLVSAIISADVKGVLPIDGVAKQEQSRLEMLYELPLQFAAEQDLKRLYQLILDRVLQLTRGAVRGALMIKDPFTGKLALEASVPADAPPISRTLILRAAREQSGFIWGDSDADQENISMSMAAIKIRSGMYAPLVWKGESIGVLFVDNPTRRSVFEEGDLRFLLSVAQYAASAVANQLLQNEITQNNQTLQHLLANFSPKIRDRLLEKSRQGRLQPGGEKSTVTILLSDLRGFTRTSSTLDSSVVVEMLNDYFRVLGEEIFRYDGTIDKFIGDAILAVYGSPEPDEQHAWKAVCSAMEMQRKMASLNERRRAANLPHCELGIGVYTGEVLHGFIGAEDCLEYTVIGDTVNKASRYCDGAQGGQIVLGPLTYYSIREHMKATETSISTKHEGQLPAWVVEWREAQ